MKTAKKILKLVEANERLHSDLYSANKEIEYLKSLKLDPVDEALAKFYKDFNDRKSIGIHQIGMVIKQCGAIDSHEDVLRLKKQISDIIDMMYEGENKQSDKK